MIATDEDALICDLAETYGILDYKALPVTKVALFSVGLRNNSRIKLKLQDTEYSMETLLLAAMVDKLSILVWSKTKEAQKGTGRPESIVTKMLGEKKEIMSFNTVDDYEREKTRILKGGGIGWGQN